MAPRSLFALVGGPSRRDCPPHGVQLPRDTVASLIVRYDRPVYPERRERIKIGGDLLNVTPEQERRTNTEERLRAVGQDGRLITRWRARWTGRRMSSTVRRCRGRLRVPVSYPGWSKEPRAASSSAAISFSVGKMACGSPDWSSPSMRPRDARTASRRARVPARAESFGADASSTVSRSSTAATRFAPTVQPPSTRSREPD